MTPTSHARLDRVEVFWGELTPCEHLVQIYEKDAAFLDALEGFVSGGLSGGEGVVVIATPAHREALEARLAPRNLDLESLRARGQYIVLDAAETLSRFMINGWPDEHLFTEVTTGLLRVARAGGRPVRAFGEMVALLWEQGHSGATVQLEHLWHRLCHREGFSLFCAYPRIGFTAEASASVKEICELHTRVVPE